MTMTRSSVDPMYPAHLLPLMQSLLATLADIDFAHECAVEKLRASPMDDALKARKVAQLEADHRLRREPWARQVALLMEMASPAREPAPKAA